MKLGKAFLAALILMAFPAVGLGVGETASKDGNGVRGLLLHDPITSSTDKWESNGSGAAKVEIVGGGGGGVSDQGISGVSDADPWNMMIRDGSGTELGLAASPFAIQIFDGAAAALFTISNQGFVDTELETADLDTGGGTDTQAVVGLRIAEIGGSELVGSANPLPVGGTVLDEIELNTDTAQTASEPAVIVIGNTATLIFAASATTRTVTMQNMGEATIFLGKSAVTTTTGVGIKGGTIDNDAKGDTAVATHGDDIYGIVAAGTENLRIQVVSD